MITVAERGCSPAAIEAYRSDLRLFLEFLSAQGHSLAVEAVTVPVLRQYMSAMSEAGLSPTTRGRRRYALRSLWNYLEASEVVTANPCRKVSAPRRAQHLPTYLTASECARLLAVCDDNHYVDLAFRDRAILSVLIYQGLRRAEVLGLALGDADLEAMTLLVRRGKNGKSRLLPMAEHVCDAIGDWLEMRPESTSAALFVTRGGSRCRSRTFSACSVVRRIGLASGTASHCTASGTPSPPCSYVRV